MEREEMGCQTFNNRVFWKVMAEDMYYSSASKNQQLRDTRKEVGQTQ